MHEHTHTHMHTHTHTHAHTHTHTHTHKERGNLLQHACLDPLQTHSDISTCVYKDTIVAAVMLTVKGEWRTVLNALICSQKAYIVMPQ